MFHNVKDKNRENKIQTIEEYGFLCLICVFYGRLHKINSKRATHNKELQFTAIKQIAYKQRIVAVEKS